MTDETRPPPEEIVLFEKDPATKIATITINRPDKHNAITIGARHRFGDLVHRCNVDDEVKVLVIRGAGEHFGTGDDLPEMADLFSDKDVSWLHDFRIGEDEGVKYPPKGSYRHLGAVTQLYSRTGEGMRDLQDFKKVSIVEVKDERGLAPDHEFLIPGEGACDYVKVLKALDRVGYDGFVDVEISIMVQKRPGYDPLAVAEQSYRVLAPAFEAAGLKRRQ